jgi:hypothetical protein
VKLQGSLLPATATIAIYLRLADRLMDCAGSRDNEEEVTPNKLTGLALLNWCCITQVPGDASQGKAAE